MWLFEDFFDDWEHGDWEYDTTICRFCHKDGFSWSKTKTGWRLITPVTRKVHSCKPYRQKARKLINLKQLGV